MFLRNFNLFSYLFSLETQIDARCLIFDNQPSFSIFSSSFFIFIILFSACHFMKLFLISFNFYLSVFILKSTSVTFISISIHLHIFLFHYLAPYNLFFSIFTVFMFFLVLPTSFPCIFSYSLFHVFSHNENDSLPFKKIFF